MHVIKLNKTLFFVALISILFTSIRAKAEQDKAVLVDQILQQSSIKIALESLPQQLSQLPHMLPISPEDKSGFMENFMQELSANYNEAEALNAIRQYFITHGEVDKLTEIQVWLSSPIGRRVTQAELLMSQQQLDFVKLQHFMQSYKPTTDPERHLLITQIVEALNLTETIFSLMENLAPKMFDVIASNSPSIKELGANTAEDFSKVLTEQLGEMKENLGEAMNTQMTSAIAFQLQEISTSELSAYTDYMVSDAGKHYINLSLYSSIEYSTDWMLDALPRLMESIEAVKKTN
jgi:hypothetical protein